MPPMTNDSSTVSLLLDAKAKLGEGAIWNKQAGQFYWVDIEGKRLHLYTPATQKAQSIELGERIGTVVPTLSNDTVIIALQSGIYSYHLSSGTPSLLVSPEAHLPGNRFNDGKCDPAGRLWVGSMELNAKENAAALYRIHTNGIAYKMLDSVTISNGICWSLDHRSMYYIDTPKGNIRSFDYDKATGKIRNEKVIVTIPEGMGHPDGMTIDAEGMLWVAMWGGSCVARWNPNDGSLLSTIEVPALNVTSCAFGGPDLQTLYITTASIGMNEEQQAQYPLAGGVFVATPGVGGVECAYWGSGDL